ncbi:SAM-dependent methyltransferase [Sphingobacterium spiritivorum]|uniref:SAM-dependent methyltransferase n=1 Tax=Sphingobacterium spiritivorum TaxID=258 RepID=UPI001918CB8C|nr:SAM-dependent methyltransferase [Sphingobacterium spiritivorum]QQT26942.1 SAM-dependent methyltransferase [Sphingobacterium spiritivorum]
MISLRYRRSRFIHALTSNTRHGTHSPFVYRLTDEAIYQRLATGNEVSLSGWNRKKKAVLGRVLHHLHIVAVHSLADNEGHEDKDSMETSEDFFKNAILISKNELPEPELFNRTGRHTIYIWDEPYLSRERQRAWEQVQQIERVTLTIDLFYFGLIIFRKGQRKQNFKLRFPRF